jgi:hypothetical protein
MDHQTTGIPPAEPSVPPVPVGLEHLLCLASTHDAFAEALIARRDAVAEAAAVVLTPGERAMLRAVPEPALRRMIASVPVPAPDRRGFLAHAALAVTALLGGTMIAACDRSAGPNRERDDEPHTVMGIEPEPKPRYGPDAGLDGSLPDAGAPDAAPAPPRPAPVPAGIRPRPRPRAFSVSDGIRP